MKIKVEIVLTQAQYDCLIAQSVKNPDNSSVTAQLESVISEHLRDIIDWSDTDVDSNSIDVNAYVPVVRGPPIMMSVGGGPAVELTDEDMLDLASTIDRPLQMGLNVSLQQT